LKNELLNILTVGAGGFIGTVSRYGISKLFQLFDLVYFPYSTLTVNITGSFIIGFLMQIVLNTNILNPRFALFLTVGFCGGFTTFSTFSYENIMLIKDGEILQAVFYILLSVISGLISIFLGFQSAKYLVTG
jgi:CrcB protein